MLYHINIAQMLLTFPHLPVDGILHLNQLVQLLEHLLIVLLVLLRGSEVALHQMTVLVGHGSQKLGVRLELLVEG